MGPLGRRQALRCFAGFVAGSPLVRAQKERLDERMPSIEEMLNVFDFEAIAKVRMTAAAWAFVSAGSDDEWTLRRNRTGFEKYLLRPRMLVDVSNLDLSCDIYGQKVAMPILVAPTGTHGQAHADGEIATVKAAGAAKTIMAVSTNSSFPLEKIAGAATGPIWFQLYPGPDLEGTKERVARAVGSGYRAIVVTVDTPYYPNRERAIRAGSEGGSRANPTRLRGAKKTTPYGVERRFTAELTWSFLKDLKSWVKVPVLVKGLMTPEDAELAVDHGADGVVVSNHGGRYLNTVPSTIEVLPSIVAAARNRIPVFIDGGFRRGTDVLKALALGAKAVLVGRPPLWGLGAFGQPGVERVLQLLESELALAMGLAGRPNLAAIDKTLVQSDP